MFIMTSFRQRSANWSSTWSRFIYFRNRQRNWNETKITWNQMRQSSVGIVQVWSLVFRL